ncbi:MAG: hypothetical protein P1Q69_19365, partial [Candidatus Thorarchaeota archaeon]|nr:hypothetical protein [Candidatus Thorarchaeota archaeon]
GLGVMILDHLPTKLVEEALKLPVNTIIHALKDDDEYNKVGRYARCDESQREHIGGMAKGETVVYLASKGMPVNVKITQLDQLLKTPLPKDGISDGAIRSRMKQALADKPYILNYEPLAKGIIERLDESDFSSPERMRKIPKAEVVARPMQMRSPDDIIASIAADARYVTLGQERIGFAQEGNLEPMVALMAGVIREFEEDGIIDLDFMTKSHVHTMHALGVPVDSTVSRDIYVLLKDELGL